MFSEVIADIQNNNLPDPDALKKRFDFALTKKLGIVKLPPPFWMQDSKINPRADHLFWAALLLRDRKRIDLALSVLLIELEQRTPGKEDKWQGSIDKKARKLVGELLDQFTDERVRNNFEQEICNLFPEWLTYQNQADNE